MHYMRGTAVITTGTKQLAWNVTGRTYRSCSDRSPTVQLWLTNFGALATTCVQPARQCNKKCAHKL
eukprot:19167-Heterococcus_DN1.PRE.2